MSFFKKPGRILILIMIVLAVAVRIVFICIKRRLKKSNLVN